MTDHVLILLATYNGTRYVKEMVESIENQDYSDWTLILSDDQSNDGTADLLEEYAQENPSKIMHYQSGNRFGNAQKHFLHLLSKFHDAPYIMFCDQDDVWHPDKVRKTLMRMKEIEKDGLPAMVHTDLKVVNQNLETIHPSFIRYSNLDGSRLALNQLLIQNVVTGCTMMINRNLAETVCENIPAEGILMHDWWIALIAAALGTTGFLDEATIDYRQHGDNVVGAKNAKSASYILSRISPRCIRQAIQDTAEQAALMLKLYGNKLTQEQTEMIRAFSQTRSASWLKRKQIYFKYKLYKNGIARVVAQFLAG